MLRNNLSSRPFYNERSATLVLGLIALAVLALTVFNATRIMALSRERATLQDHIDRNQDAINQVRTETQAVEATLGTATLNGLLASTREANSLIDERTFSWTVFFDFIERTLPYDVRLVAVAPRIDRGVFLVRMIVVTKQSRDLQGFYRAMRETGAFSEILSVGQNVNDDGTYRVEVEARYHPPKLQSPQALEAPAPATPAAASPGGPGTNGRAGGRGGRP